MTYVRGAARGFVGVDGRAWRRRMRGAAVLLGGLIRVCKQSETGGDRHVRPR